MGSVRNCFIGSIVLLFAGAGCLGVAKVGEAKKAERKGPFQLAEVKNRVGIIQDWLIAGPFPDPGGRPNSEGWDVDYLKAEGGEKKIKPFEGMVIKYDGQNRIWKPYHFEDMVNLFDIPEIYEEGEDILVYAACYIESEDAKEAVIYTGSDDGYKMWLNHAQIANLRVYRGSGPDMEEYKVHLKKGFNLVLLKVNTDFGGFDFYFRITDPEGKVLEGIKVWL